MKKLLITFGSAILLAACSHTPTAADIDKQNAATQEAQQSESAVAAEGSLETVSVEIASFAFSPKTITVKPGTVIKITNRDVASHTMTSDDDNSFNTPLIGKDQSVELTAPTTPGSYDFHCTPHPNMKGTLIVEAE